MILGRFLVSLIQLSQMAVGYCPTFFRRAASAGWALATSLTAATYSGLTYGVAPTNGFWSVGACGVVAGVTATGLGPQPASKLNVTATSNGESVRLILSSWGRAE